MEFSDRQFDDRLCHGLVAGGSRFREREHGVLHPLVHCSDFLRQSHVRVDGGRSAQARSPCLYAVITAQTTLLLGIAYFFGTHLPH